MWIGMTALDVLRRIRIEEAMLLRHFGDEYRVYMKVTGRLLPRIIGASGGRHGDSKQTRTTPRP